MAVIDHAVPLLEEAAGTHVDGIVGAPDPVVAVHDAINLRGFDEIIVSTLPKTLSRWLKLDLPSKLSGTGLPVSTITAQEAAPVHTAVDHHLEPRRALGCLRWQGIHVGSPARALFRGRPSRMAKLNEDPGRLTPGPHALCTTHYATYSRRCVHSASQPFATTRLSPRGHAELGDFKPSQTARVVVEFCGLARSPAAICRPHPRSPQSGQLHAPRGSPQPKGPLPRGTLTRTNPLSQSPYRYDLPPVPT
jgi:hypothetical protein